MEPLDKVTSKTTIIFHPCIFTVKKLKFPFLPNNILLYFPRRTVQLTRPQVISYNVTSEQNKICLILVLGYLYVQLFSFLRAFLSLHSKNVLLTYIFTLIDGSEKPINLNMVKNEKSQLGISELDKN